MWVKNAHDHKKNVQIYNLTQKNFHFLTSDYQRVRNYFKKSCVKVLSIQTL